MVRLIDRLQQQFRQRIWRWLDKRQPTSEMVRLRQRFMFVFPTRFGFGMAALVLLLYILGTNYQNNLILLLAYLLLVLVVSTIVLAFLNLHHCELSARPLADVFAGQSAAILLTLQRRTGLPLALDAGWQQPDRVIPVNDATVILELPAPKRGYFAIPRLKLQSVYPFGLVRCWCYVRLDCHYWVFPAPIPAHFEGAQADPNQKNAEEWSGQRQYQPGDPWRQLDWKRFSRQQQLLVHQFSATTLPGSDLWLCADLRLNTVEAQLSDLAERALRAEQMQQPFGLRRTPTDIAVGSGPAHLRQVLQALALW
ncbi:MAG: DUF58 domain-containing protein [Rheinheimera sp.]|nr:DUF58 domain-containing protein [Rheinheimera sp.]